MKPVTNLSELLLNLSPSCDFTNYVYVVVSNSPKIDLDQCNPFAIIKESEGVTLITTQKMADAIGYSYNEIFHCITLNVHSSLNAVGLTAVVSTALAKENISANMIAGNFHDHIFIPSKDSKQAVDILKRLSQTSSVIDPKS